MRREETKVVQIGNCKIGGGNPIAIQSMTNTKTEDVEATVARYWHWRQQDATLSAALCLRWRRRKHSQR